MSDTISVLIWWVTIFIVGLSMLPLTQKIFGRFIDRGYIFSKVLGILLVSYIVWLGGTVRIIPFFREGIFLVVLLLGAINFWIFQKIKSDLPAETTKIALIFAVLEELLFLGTLSLWSYIKANEPSIHGLEKFMDFGFVNSILRAPFFPPLDMWLTHTPSYTGGYYINYYYFGHLITAVLTKLSNIDSAITYNLMIATLFALTFSLTFSIGMNLFYFLKKSIFSHLASRIQLPISHFQLLFCGFLTAFIVTLGGNLHTIYAFTTGYPNDKPVPFWTLKYGYHPETYWYPNATRFIPYTIHEFPIYSFVVSDLHGHVSDIPFVLLTLALLFNLLIKNNKAGGTSEETTQRVARVENKKEILRGEKSFEPFTSAQGKHSKNKTLALRNEVTKGAQKNLGRSFSKISIPSLLNNFLHEFETRTSVSLPYLLLIGILLAVMYMTNAVDGPIYMVLTGLILLYRNWSSTHRIKKAFIQTFSASLFLLFFFLLSGLPFSIYFKPFGTGIGVLCAPEQLLGKHLGPLLFEEGKCQKSPWWMIMILWGFFYYNVVGFLLFIIIPRLKEKWEIRREKRDAEMGSENSRSKNSKNQNIPPQHLTSHFPHLTSISSRLTSTDIFVIATIIVSTLLLIFPEFFYIKDIYPMHYRANTMFKLGYQAFMMLGIASIYILLRIYEAFKTRFCKTSEPKKPKMDFIWIAIILVSAIISFLFHSTIGLVFSSLLLVIRALLYFIFRKNTFILSKASLLYIFYFVGFAGVFFLIAIYPLFAVNSYFGGLRTYSGLDGLGWLQKQYPEDYAAITYIRANIAGQPVILEANGDSYTDYARVSGNTGLPTVIGWPVHEWLWRGSYDEAGKRIPEVQALYESKDLTQTRQLIQKYNISYVFLGVLERQKYPNLDESKWEKLGGKVIFQSGNTKVYEIN